MAKILIVEDDADTAEALELWLTSNHYDVELVDDGARALEFLGTYNYAVVILDVDLPSISGFEVCSRYRAAGGTARIIMLTGKHLVRDKLEGLDSGADDYLTKPFEPEELEARIRALLRRPVNILPNRLCVGKISLDANAHVVTVEGKEVSLAPREFALLEFFMRHPNKVFSHTDLLNSVWTADSEVSPHAVRVCINRLREKVGFTDLEFPDIRTVFAKGYQFVEKAPS